jgi:tetratricopeptide (TPR) repeat protein
MSNDQKKAGVPFRLPNESIVHQGNSQPQQINLQQAMAQASQLQANGDLQQSEGVLRNILQANPHFAPALHLLGVIAHQSAQPSLAIQLINQAISNNDKIPLFHANLGEMYRIQEQLNDAIRHGEIAVGLDPNMASAHSNLGIAYYDKEDYERAKASQQRALEIDGNLLPALNNMGSILREEKQIEEAMEFYRRAIAVNPQYLEPFNNLGLMLIEDDRPEEAIQPLTHAVTLNPAYSDAHCNLGAAYSAMEEYDKAFPCYQMALKERPEYAQAHTGIARIFQEKDNFKGAEAAAKKAIELEPDKAGAHCVLATIYMDTGLPEEAEKYFDRALELDKDSYMAHLGKGHLHMEQGDFDAAEKSFRYALELEPDGYGPRYSLSQLRKSKTTDENFIALTSRQDVESIKAREAIPFNYALGKCYDDVAEYEKAFEYYMEGARLKRDTIHFEIDDLRQSTDELISIFTSDFINSLKGSGDSSELPIFVLGMPRSGTTLTEQIIASHPKVYGAGELGDLKDVATNHLQTNIPFPGNLKGIGKQDLPAFGAEYVKRLQQRAPDFTRITDKMPGNYQLVGLIHLILPSAKIIHVKRSPMDTCVSCFSRLFRHNQNQSYDLTEQGLFYRNYHRLMQHWRQVLPEGAFYEVQYEDLVKDNEAQAKQLIDFCGLDWNNACLEFYKDKRTVRTASITQVRQPIYTSSMERWRRYEKYLDPLKQALGDLHVD